LAKQTAGTRRLTEKSSSKPVLASCSSHTEMFVNHDGICKRNLLFCCCRDPDKHTNTKRDRNFVHVPSRIVYRESNPIITALEHHFLQTGAALVVLQWWCSISSRCDSRKPGSCDVHVKPTWHTSTDHRYRQ
jgi:hypothetical protein